MGNDAAIGEGTEHCRLSWQWPRFQAIRQSLDDPGQANIVAQKIRARVRAEFSIDTMVEGGLAAYREALLLRKLAQFT